jgi:arsenate reductase
MLEARSAGTKPAEAVSEQAIIVMREKGIDISTQRPKALTGKLIEWSDIRISMGCGVERSCPAAYLGLFEDWAIQDPYRMPIEDYRRARDEIEGKVRTLLDRLKNEK